MCALPRDWTTLLPLRKTLSAFLFQLHWLLEQYVLHCIRYWAGRKKPYKGNVKFHWWDCLPIPFVLQKDRNPQSKLFLVYEKVAWNCVEQEIMDYSEFQNVLPKNIKAITFARASEKCKICGNLREKDVVNLIDHGCFKTRDLYDPKADEGMWTCSNHPFWQLQSTSQLCLLTENAAFEVVKNVSWNVFSVFR